MIDRLQDEVIIIYLDSVKTFILCILMEKKKKGKTAHLPFQGVSVLWTKLADTHFIVSFLLTVWGV